LEALEDERAVSAQLREELRMMNDRAVTAETSLLQLQQQHAQCIASVGGSTSIMGNVATTGGTGGGGGDRSSMFGEFVTLRRDNERLLLQVQQLQQQLQRRALTVGSSPSVVGGDPPTITSSSSSSTSTSSMRGIGNQRERRSLPRGSGRTGASVTVNEPRPFVERS
jgi:hypothetical protein